jgi:hypothetical protein
MHRDARVAFIGYDHVAHELLDAIGNVVGAFGHLGVLG